MSLATPTDVETTVKTLLDAAQLRVSDDEFQLFVKIYPAIRAGADAMYMAETRYEEPSLNFDATWPENTPNPEES